MRFVVDMPLPPALAKHLVQMGHDAVHVSEAGMFDAADEEILAYASQDQRIVVTADLDFPRLLSLSQAALTSVILFRGGDFDDATALVFMRRALMAIDSEEPRIFLMTVDHQRIRRRWLT